MVGVRKKKQQFKATYRIGNGAAGNVGGEAICHLLLGWQLADRQGFQSAAGLRGHRRGRHRSRASRRAAGVPHPGTRGDGRRLRRSRGPPPGCATRRGDLPLDRKLAHGIRHRRSHRRRDGGRRFEGGLRRHLERFRMAGYDLEVDAPHFVPLDVSLHVCVKPGYFRSAVHRRGARRVVERACCPTGVSAPFTPTTSPSASRCTPAAWSRPRSPWKAWNRCAWIASSGWSIRIRRAQEDGVIPIGRLEVAQLENDPNYRDRGRLLVSAGGGQ